MAAQSSPQSGVSRDVPPVAHARVRPPSRPRSSDVARGASLAAGLIAIVVAIACAAGGLVIAAAYPLAPMLIVALFVAWSVFAWLRFPLALPTMLALLPVTGFAAITGWLTFEELDLLVLASAAGGYAALAMRAMGSATATDDRARRHRPALSIFSCVLLALFLASTTIALERGFASAGGFRFDWTQGYDDPLNSLRIYKSFVWALLMTPLLLDEVRRPGGLDRIGLGLTAALGLVGLAVLRERLAFTGLLDFSDDYRVTAPFWEMHFGGAALDGFLALTVPFAVRDALRHPDVGASGDHAVERVAKLRMLLAWLVLALAGYACLVTFSRGVYAAVPLSLLLLTVLVFRQRLRLERRGLWPLLLKGALLAALVAASSFVVFRSGGYRAVLATFVVLSASIPVAAAMRQASIATWSTAAVAATIVGSIGYLLADLLPKGPYLVFGLALVAAVGVAVRIESRSKEGSTPVLPTSLAMTAIAAWLWLAGCACLIARAWGGTLALRDSAIVVGGLIVATFAASRFGRPVWPERRREQIATVGFAALVMGSVAVFTAGAYMGGRFSASRGDLDIRIAHWTEGIGRLHGADDWLFGEGLGRFPATSLFESNDGTVPGTYRVEHRDGERFVAMTTPRMRYFGFDVFLRLSQRVTVRPQTTYVAKVRIRAPHGMGLHVELCEKQLIYHGTCTMASQWTPEGSDWHDIALPLASGDIGRWHWYGPKPVFLAIAGTDADRSFDVERVQLIGPDGVDLIANGDFGNGTARWFSSSDKYHLPWHIKNIALDVLFDQGTIGLALFALLVGGALLRTTVGRTFRHPDAPFVAAGIAGYLVVGAFDSLLDVPRVAFAFYLVVLLGLMLRNPRVASADKVVPASEPVPVVDEAAARAERRRRAFGERVRTPR